MVAEVQLQNVKFAFRGRFQRIELSSRGRITARSNDSIIGIVE